MYMYLTDLNILGKVTSASVHVAQIWNMLSDELIIYVQGYSYKRYSFHTRMELLHIVLNACNDMYIARIWGIIILHLVINSFVIFTDCYKQLVIVWNKRL